LKAPKLGSVVQVEDSSNHYEKKNNLSLKKYFYGKFNEINIVAHSIPFSQVKLFQLVVIQH